MLVGPKKEEGWDETCLKMNPSFFLARLQVWVCHAIVIMSESSGSREKDPWVKFIP